MLPHIRRQVTLYVPTAAAVELEAVRRIVDPVQSSLIAAHVTLCREDEIQGLSGSELQRRVANERCQPIALHFGRIEVFSGHGMLLACVGGQDEFHALRRQVLGRADIRTAQPHITLAHPRNPKAAGNSLAAVAGLSSGMCITFPSVCLIEQTNMQPWRVLERIAL